MKTKSIFLILTFLSIFISCTEEELMETLQSRHITITAYMPDAQNSTRAVISPKDDNLDLLLQWSESDFFNVHVLQDGNYYPVLKGDDLFNHIIPISSISEDRRSCTFEFDMPKDVDMERDYTIMGANNIEWGIVSDLYENDEDFLLECFEMCGHRPDALHIPMYFMAPKSTSMDKVNFKHCTTYEVLHVTNNSSQSIKLHFDDDVYDVAERWYYLQNVVVLPTGQILAIDTIDNVTGPYYPWNNEYEIGQGESKAFFSNYVPTGRKIKDLRLNVTINGEKVSSSNTLSSDMELEIGKAYHMYATWDGQELRFGKPESGPYETDDYILSGDRRTLIKWKNQDSRIDMTTDPSLANLEVIGEEAFRELNTLKSLVLPQKVRVIDRDAFYMCKNLESITLPNSLLSIGIEAFGNCSNLKDIVIPNSVEEIGRSAFYGCNSLISIEWPDKVKAIREWTFYNCYNLKQVILPESLQIIDEGAFLFCSELEEIVIPNSVITIGNSAFARCTSLSSIELSHSLVKIGIKAFQECQMENITIPQTVKEIGGEAFSQCTRLSSINVESGNNYFTSDDGVLFNIDKTRLLICGNARTGTYTIPSTVTTVGSGAFYGCSALTDIYIPNSVKTIELNAFRDCDALSSITLPNSVTELGSYILYSCENLVSVHLPESLETIPAWLCAWSPLTELAIPASVKKMDRQAFEGCNLAKVTIYAALPPSMEWGVFNTGLQDNAVLYVPAESIEAYKNEKNFEGFSAILPIE